MIDPIEVLNLYAAKNLYIVYCDTDRSRLGLAERLKGERVFIIDMKDPESADPEWVADVAIIVYTKDWSDEQSSLESLATNFVFISGKDFMIETPPATDEEHGWTER